MSTSGLAAAILDLSLPDRSDSTVCTTVGLLDPENIGLAVGNALLSCVQVEIRVLPDCGRHLGFITSGLVGQYHRYFCLIARHRKHSFSFGIALLLCIH